MVLNIEVWKDVIGYENLYQISNLGRVKSLAKKRFTGKNFKTIREYPEKILSTKFNNNGYEQTTICKNGVLSCFLVHRLVAKSFLLTDDFSKQVNHINGDKKCNNLENLEWVSSRENECHKQTLLKKTSNYIGVSFVAKSNKWRSQIQFNGRKIHLGFYDSEEEAYLKRCIFESENKISNKYL
jgi:hypothetical protein